MSNVKLRQLLTMKPVWNTPGQFAVLVVLADHYRDERGYAWPSRDRIAHRISCTQSRVRQIIRELERLHLIGRLGPEKGGKPNRYDLTLDPSERVKPASWLEGVAGYPLSKGGEGSAGYPLSKGPVEKEGSAGYPLGGSRLPGEGSAGYPERGQPATPDLLIDLPSTYLGSGTATAQPRLPTPQSVHLTEKEQRAQATRRRLASEPGKNRNYDVLRKLAHALLKNPTAAKQYLKVPIRNEGDLLECVKRAAARNVVKYGLTTTDGQGVVHAAVKAAWFHFTNPKVIRGQAPRPRDVKRVRR